MGGTTLVALKGLKMLFLASFCLGNFPEAGNTKIRGISLPGASVGGTTLVAPKGFKMLFLARFCLGKDSGKWPKF